MVERFNRTLINAISKSARDIKNWDTVIPIILLHYRTTEHSATSFTPAKLMFGRELTLPIDMIFPPKIENYHSDHVS